MSIFKKALPVFNLHILFSVICFAYYPSTLVGTEFYGLEAAKICLTVEGKKTYLGLLDSNLKEDVEPAVMGGYLRLVQQEHPNTDYKNLVKTPQSKAYIEALEALKEHSQLFKDVQTHGNFALNIIQLLQRTVDYYDKEAPKFKSFDTLKKEVDVASHKIFTGAFGWGEIATFDQARSMAMSLIDSAQRLARQEGGDIQELLKNYNSQGHFKPEIRTHIDACRHILYTAYTAAKNNVAIEEKDLNKDVLHIPGVLAAFKERGLVRNDVSQLRDFFTTYKSPKRLKGGKPTLKKEDVHVEFLKDSIGKNNLGIYKIIKTTKGRQTTYFAKICDDPEEPSTYGRLQGYINTFNSLSQQDYPRFVKYKGTFSLPRNSIDQYFKEAAKKISEGGAPLKEYPVLLLEPAKGQALDHFMQRAYATMAADEIQRTFRKIGCIIGNLHSYGSSWSSTNLTGYAHGDLTLGNIFYSPEDGLVTLIDYVGFSNQSLIGPAVQEFFTSGVATGLEPLIKNCKNKNQADKIKAIINGLQQGVLDAFKDPTSKAIIRYSVTALSEEVLNFLHEFFPPNELPDMKEIEREHLKATFPPT